jgi:hypothetical protein
MRNLILSGLLLTIAFGACQNKKNVEQPKAVIPVAEIAAKAGTYVDQLIEVDGMAVHVCRESGKRLFLGEEQFKVMASDKIGKFDVTLEGSDIAAIGYVRESRIDENYLAEWEKELQGAAQVQMKEEVHTYEAESKGEDESAVDTQMKQIKNYRDQIAASEKGYLSFYSLDAISVTEKK